MKKYNIQNYIRYKEDIKASMPDEKPYSAYTRDELVIKFLPLVENLARKFSTTQQASGVLSINDLLQEGGAGLTKAVDKIDWERLSESEDQEKTIKSFFSKRIKGAIRRAIDINRGDIKIPEHALTKIRKNPKDDKMVALFFNSMFSSYDITPADEDNFAYQLPDKSEPYNINILNAYLLSLMREHLIPKQYDVLRLFYGLDCDKLSAKDIAKYIGLTVPTATVIVSQIKKEAIDHLIANVDTNQVIDYL
jgi:RNA polymerase sigma factor (sigma-70 family)|tara:strand:+ start:2611 stop:3360 length:750 start_codon:yes stop_codon:yes gene_type:complete